VAAAATATAALLAGGASPAAAADCGTGAIAQPFIDHMNTAHLERSPLQQVKDLLHADSYVLAHTVLIESMLGPIAPTAGAVLEPFEQHMYAAHLERSPLQQAKDLIAADDYVLAHTVLVGSMIKPMLRGCADPGAPAPVPMPAHGSAPAPPPPPAAAAVAIHTSAYAPKSIAVPAGTTVTWTNHDDDDHNVTGSGMKSASFGKDATYSHAFTDAGMYAYVCSLHPQMKGTVTVQ
jgi:plastocyanin